MDLTIAAAVTTALIRRIGTEMIQIGDTVVHLAREMGVVNQIEGTIALVQWVLPGRWRSWVSTDQLLLDLSYR